MSKTRVKSGQSDQLKRPKKITHNQISKRAHKIYLNRLKTDGLGDEEGDWLQAEDELNSEY